MALMKEQLFISWIVGIKGSPISGTIHRIVITLQVENFKNDGERYDGDLQKDENIPKADKLRFIHSTIDLTL